MPVLTKVNCGLGSCSVIRGFLTAKYVTSRQDRNHLGLTSVAGTSTKIRRHRP